MDNTFARASPVEDWDFRFDLAWTDDRDLQRFECAATRVATPDRRVEAPPFALSRAKMKILGEVRDHLYAARFPGTFDQLLAAFRAFDSGLLADGEVTDAADSRRRWCVAHRAGTLRVTALVSREAPLAEAETGAAPQMADT